MAKDKYHGIVKNAMKKDSWAVTHDPLVVPTGSRNLDIDLGAERIIGAEKEGEKIAVEVKSFVGHSTLHEFYKAIGQYAYYARAVRKSMPERTLFLAIPSDVYEDFILKDPFNLDFVKEEKINLFVYNIEKEEIELWIRH
ncbi:MAG: element excision factor XisH family protein [Bacteroidota bacterium]